MFGSLWILWPTKKANLWAYWQGAGTLIIPCRKGKKEKKAIISGNLNKHAGTVTKTPGPLKSAYLQNLYSLLFMLICENNFTYTQHNRRRDAKNPKLPKPSALLTPLTQVSLFSAGLAEGGTVVSLFLAARVTRLKHTSGTSWLCWAGRAAGASRQLQPHSSTSTYRSGCFCR